MTVGAEVVDLPAFDGEEVRRFADLFTPPGCPVSLVGEFSSGAVATEFVALEDVVTTALAMHRMGCTSLWQRLCALTAKPPSGRGKASASAYFPGFWFDVDLGTEGHRFDPAKHGGLTLPQTVEQAMNLIRALGWGEPTAVVSTGGGLHVYFLLDTWLAISDDNRAEVMALSDLAQQVFGWVCSTVGFHYGNVGNLDRPMRVAGSVNRKRNRTRPAAVRFHAENGPRHVWSSLVDMLQRSADQFRPAPTSTPPVSGAATGTPTDSERFLATGGRVSQSLNILQAFGDLDDADHALLPPLSFTLHGREGETRIWTRDGEPASPRSLSYGYAGTRTFVVYSDAIGAPTLVGLNAGRMLAWLRFGGDEQATARALTAIARNDPGVDTLGLPASHVAALREHWNRWQAARGGDAPGPSQAAPGAVLPPTDARAVAPPDDLERMTQLELLRQRAQRAAREALRAEDEQATGVSAESWGAEAGTLTELEQLPAEPPARITGLWPAGGRVTMVAPRKSGKTTLAMNVTRCVLTGEDFLGRFPVRALEPGRRVAFLNYEVSARQFLRWCREHDVDPDRVWVVNLRGRANPLATASGRAWLAQQLREHGCTVVVLDTFGRAFTGENQDSNSEVTRFLAGVIDPLLADAGVSELLMTVHTGWGGERSRGASALEDWPDALWRLVRPGGDPKDRKDGEPPVDTGQRYFSAEGRDVDVPEDALAYDPDTRTLTLSGAGNRHEARDNRRAAELLEHLVPLIREQPGVHGRALEAEYRASLQDGKGLSSGAVGKALGLGVESGRLSVRLGQNRAKHYSVIRL